MTAITRESAVGNAATDAAADVARNAPHGLDRFLHPRAVVVIGASDDPNRVGGRTVQNLLRGGFPGRIYPVNPNRAVVQGLAAYPSIADVPADIDCAVVAVPGPLVLEAVEACAARGIGAAVIFSAGFSEAGAEGAERQQRLRQIARESGMRIVGPNCLGVFNARNGAWLSFTTQFQERIEGPAIGMVSQSGGSAAHLLRLAQDRGLEVGTFITTGNEVDVEFGEGLIALADDPDTNLILAYIEGVRHRDSLIEGLERARRNGKPVLMLKVGRTGAGAQAAASHTASLAGEDRVYDAIFRSYGVFRARSTEELLDVACAASGLRRFPTGNRLGVVTISGGMGAQIADVASDAGLVLPRPPEEAEARLKALCPPGSPLNPVDLTAQLSTDPHLLANSLRVLIETGEYDALFAFFGVYASVPRLAEVFLEDLTKLREDHPDIPIVLSVICGPEDAARYQRAGYLVYEEPARAVRALAALPRFAAAFARPARTAPGAGMRAIPAGEAYSEAAAKAVLAGAGIPSPAERSVASAAEVAAAAAGMNMPVALKILSRDILHKTEVGGVELGLASAEEAGAAALAMEARVAERAPDARREGFLLSEMVVGGVELILGARRDPLFGPLVMVGLGGVTAELFKDVSLRLAPVDEETALEMLKELRSFPLLDGWRGAPRTDIEAAARAVSALSLLAAANADTMETIEVNPLRVLEQGRGVVALDAVIETRKAE